MDNKSDDWKDLYDIPENQQSPVGPMLFYNDTVMDHFTNPRNIGEMTENDASGFSVTGDPACGDQLYLWIKVMSNRIVDIKFKTFGCPGAIASSSMLTELAKDKTIAQAKELTDDDVIIALKGIPERKKHCSLLGVIGLHEAIKNYRKKQKNQKEKV